MFNSKLYMVAYVTGSGRELVACDTSHSCSVVVDPNGNYLSSDVKHLTVFNSKLYFTAKDSKGQELWSCTTADVCARVNDLKTGSQGSDPDELAVFNNMLWLLAPSTDTEPNELWACTTADVCSLQYSVTGFRSLAPKYFTVAGGKAYFAAVTIGDGWELHSCDSSGSCGLELDLWPGSGSSVPQSLIEYRGYLYFVAKDDTEGYEWWRTTA